ncbi:hypothetical protein C343_01082 [Cryptococcus neoformans C23]|uniref:Uncharacterized protein n=2 Tax=Cryptococcus neoformans TaxID=5207 RepID=A0A854QN78_CRYNE|nr:hypothetical protein CNAG_03688 [Cryptococcus neoformans var. grubii H99]AUB22700.1 hypothetical protein CKF44_03688 [Cryptococcus neoformans var. grubii]OWT42127.1 hypothetical protein C362_00499 [Cryptococcus neoformans var. grubii Bt1]OWZ35415.1 hypothetical protein C347_01152 [Cryptococcus neoformans var. grubii AD2-60a]OWZ47294.1 hypothetical protein C343_01082 [Cryptococcus neoformans var. grubii C23]OWZ51982.1 hypothetical protein C353_01099 [Cryptococcus neoformans var. grubii AD1-8|eukprot:XP_012047390.1 hypothetical protein CNAG_03688 [Cryptococcus neoformans var. grubii H99]
MEGQIDNAKKFLNSEQGQGLKQQLFGGGDSNTQQDNGPTKDIQGNQGAPGQFGQQGQYGAVTGSGFGGGLAKDAQGQPLQGGKQGQKDSPYEGMDNDDTTASGGYGRNAQGGAFSRQNQMGTDHLNHLNPGGVYDGDDGREGYKTGYSTPGYRKEDETEEQLRQSNRNVYGQQSDDRGSKDNDYHEI